MTTIILIVQTLLLAFRYVVPPTSATISSESLPLSPPPPPPPPIAPAPSPVSLPPESSNRRILLEHANSASRLVSLNDRSKSDIAVLRSSDADIMSKLLPIEVDLDVLDSDVLREFLIG